MPETVLDYASSPETGNARRRWWLAFVIGAAVGYVVALLLLGVLRAGGPIFPMTVLFAPVAVFVEWIPSQPSTLSLEWKRVVPCCTASTRFCWSRESDGATFPSRPPHTRFVS